jgi:anti-sigma regulatory factor (Ser/Thr protein kinase)
MAETCTISLPAEKEHLKVLVEFILGFARRHDMDHDRLWKLELAAEEVLGNIIEYAYPANKGNIEILCSLVDHSGLAIEIQDHGIPFNPLSFPRSEPASDIEAIRTKGFGIYLLRNLVDTVVYRREGNRNCLTLEKRGTRTGAPRMAPACE